jgi:hypothetical protein
MESSNHQADTRKRRSVGRSAAVTLVVVVLLVAFVLWGLPSAEAAPHEVWYDTPGERYALKLAKVEIGHTKIDGEMESITWATLPHQPGTLDTGGGPVLVAQGEAPFTQYTEVRLVFEEIYLWYEDGFTLLRLDTDTVQVRLQIPGQSGEAVTISIDGPASHHAELGERVFQPRVLSSDPAGEPRNDPDSVGAPSTPVGRQRSTGPDSPATTPKENEQSAPSSPGGGGAPGGSTNEADKDDGLDHVDEPIIKEEDPPPDETATGDGAQEEDKNLLDELVDTFDETIQSPTDTLLDEPELTGDLL